MTTGVGRAAPTIARVAAISAAAGAFFGALIAESGEEARTMAASAFIGVCIAGGLTTLELVVLRSSVGEWLRRTPFAVHLAVKTVVYLVVFVAAIRLGILLFLGIPPLAGWGNPTFLWGIAFSFAVGFTINFVVSVNRMLGHNVLASFVLGCYHRPREEERVFMFIDLEASTRIAEQIGATRFHSLLNRFFFDMSGPVLAHCGQISKYVGDEAMVTWPLDAGIRDANCVRCCFAIGDRLAARAERYRSEFGVVPQFRAGFHCGAVVAGEMGDSLKEIAYLGDTVNVAARLIDKCRELDRHVLATDDLVARLVLPPDIDAEDMGTMGLRGREQPIRLYALRRDPAARVSPDPAMG